VRLKDKVALVTGGAQGLGKAIAPGGRGTMRVDGDVLGDQPHVRLRVPHGVLASDQAQHRLAGDVLDLAGRRPLAACGRLGGGPQSGPVVLRRRCHPTSLRFGE